MTADQITAALNAIGWSPEITYQYVPWSSTKTDVGHTNYPVFEMVDGTMQFVGYDTAEMATRYNENNYIQVPVIGSGGITKTGTGAAAPSSGGGGTGGGGGSKPAKKEVKKKIRGRDEIERYHKNNDTIERLASSLDKIDKLKDRAYGKDHLAQLNAETNALEKQLAAQ